MQKIREGKIKINDDTKKNLIRIIFFIILSFCYLIFFFNKQGQPIIKIDIDGQFNFSRVMGLENIWKSPINFKYFNHCASAVNLMYPWATIYPMYLLIKLTGSLVGGYYIYFLIITFATFEITYQSVRHMNQPALPSIFASVLYTFSICRTSDIYCRVDMGEAIAMTFFPIVLLGIYYIFYDDIPHWKTLAAGMTLLVYTHVLSLVIAALLVLFFTFISIIRKKFTKLRYISLLKATGMSILLGSGFLIPMLQVLSFKINGPCIVNLFANALTPQQLLSCSLTNTVGGRDVYDPVFLILFVIIICNLKKIKGFFRDVLIAAVFFTFLSTSLFPWDIFQKIFYILQFPWRFITIATLLFSVVATEIIKSYQVNHSKHKLSRIVEFLILGILLIHWGTMTNLNQENGYHIGTNSQMYTKLITNNSDFNGIGDYYPKLFNNGDSYRYISSQMVYANQSWYVEKANLVNTDKLIFNIESRCKTRATLPVYVFPGEKVVLNGVSQLSRASQKNGATVVNLINGKNEIEVSYGYSLLARIAWIVSLLSCFMFNGFTLYKRYIKK